MQNIRSVDGSTRIFIGVERLSCPKHDSYRRRLVASAAVIAMACASGPAHAQSSSTQYFYDAAGRLQTVISNGTAIYSYDRVGNVTSVSTLSATTFVIANATPATVTSGQTLQIAGYFGGNANTTNVTVAINGVAAAFVGMSPVTPTTLSVAVPSNVTTGTITVVSPAGTGAGPYPVSVSVVSPVPPEISSFSPSPISGGGTLTIGGTGFDPNVANDKVYINGQRIEVVTATASRIVAIVPLSFGPGPVTVETASGVSSSVTLGSENGLVVGALGNESLSSIGSLQLITAPEMGSCTTLSSTVAATAEANDFVFYAPAGARLYDADIDEDDRSVVHLFGPTGAGVSTLTALPQGGYYTLTDGCLNTCNQSLTLSAELCIASPPAQLGTASGNGSMTINSSANNPGENLSYALTPTNTSGEAVSMYLNITSSPDYFYYNLTLDNPDYIFNIDNWTLDTPADAFSTSFPYYYVGGPYSWNFTGTSSGPITLPYIFGYTADIVPQLGPSVPTLGSVDFTMYWFNPAYLPGIATDLSSGGTASILTNQEPGQGYAVQYNNLSLGKRTLFSIGITGPSQALPSSGVIYLNDPNGNPLLWPLTNDVEPIDSNEFCDIVEAVSPGDMPNRNCYFSPKLQAVGNYTVSTYPTGGGLSGTFSPTGTLTVSAASTNDVIGTITANGVAQLATTNVAGQATELAFPTPGLNGYPMSPEISALFCYPYTIHTSFAEEVASNYYIGYLQLSDVITQGSNSTTTVVATSSFLNQQSGSETPDVCFYIDNTAISSAASNSYTLTSDLGPPQTGTGTVTLYSIPAPTYTNLGTAPASGANSTTSPGQDFGFAFTGGAQGDTVSASFTQSLPNAPWGPVYPSVQMEDSNGATLCSSDSLTLSSCSLSGNTPYSILAHAGGPVVGTITATVSAPRPGGAHVPPDISQLNGQTIGQYIHDRNSVSVPFAMSAGERIALETEVDATLVSGGQCYRTSIIAPDGTTFYESRDSCDAITFSAALPVRGRPSAPTVGVAVAGTYTATITPLGNASGWAHLGFHLVPPDASAKLSGGAGEAQVTTVAAGQEAQVVFSASRPGRASIVVDAIKEGPGRQCRNVRILQPDGSVLREDLACGTHYRLPHLVLPKEGIYGVIISPSGIGTGTYDIKVHVL